MIAGVPPSNVFDDEAEYEPNDPPGYRNGAKTLEADVARALTAKVFELPADQSVCPYHYEYVEEWLVVLDGRVVLRTPDGERDLERGDAVCFPAGPDGAHKVTNRDPAVARVLMFSSAATPAVAVYPDSDKIGVWPGGDGDTVMLRRGDGQVGYWEGET